MYLRKFMVSHTSNEISDKPAHPNTVLPESLLLTKHTQNRDVNDGLG